MIINYTPTTTIIIISFHPYKYAIFLLKKSPYNIQTFRKIAVLYKLNAPLKRTASYICVPTANKLVRLGHTNIAYCSFSGVCVYIILLSPQPINIYLLLINNSLKYGSDSAQSQNVCHSANL